MALPGGSSTLYGVLYQLLGSLHHSIVRLRIERQGQTVRGARVTVEPPHGDFRIESPAGRIVEQWKSRSNGRPWGLQEVLNKVIPDFYLEPALDLLGDQTSYVFATEGHPAPTARAFFDRLRGSVPGNNPLAGLSQEDRDLFRAAARNLRKQPRARVEPVRLTHERLRRLLSRFQIRGSQSVDQLIQGIDQRLIGLVDHNEDRTVIRDHLCMILLRKGTGTAATKEFTPEDLLKEAGLHGVSLESGDELWRTAQEILDREIARRRYQRTMDVRETPNWPAGRRILFVSGESGQGKTWQAIQLVLERAKKGRIVALIDSRGDADRDLQKAADLLWNQAWRRDKTIPLDRLVGRWSEVRGCSEEPWLTVCVENVQSPAEALALLYEGGWESRNAELILTGAPQVGRYLAEEHSEQVHHLRLRDFSPAELREYLRRAGRSWDTVPSDVRDTLRRPLLAGIYSSLGSDQDFAPTREYELYEASWKKVQRGLSQYPEDLHLLKKLALRLLDQAPLYPWTWDQLREIGVDPATRERLEKIGWLTSKDDGVEAWHDRMLSWAIAEALEDRASPETASQLLEYPRHRGTRVGRILNYVAMDLLWLVSGNPAKRHLVPDLLISLEGQNRPFGARQLYRGDALATLGRRIIPGFLQRLRLLPNQDRSSLVNPAEDALTKILDRDSRGLEELPALLSDSSQVVRKVAIRVLAKHPHSGAVDRLWSLLRESSLAMENHPRGEGIYARRTAFSALRACLDLDPGWLHSKIQEIQPESDPVWELAYLLANLKQASARSIWLESKSSLFAKVRPGHLDSLMVCIRVFRDRDEVPRLESWLHVEEKWTANSSLDGIARINPDRALSLLETAPLEQLLASRGPWLPILLLQRPDETRRVLRQRMAEAGNDFWRVAGMYGGYEEWMDRQTVEALIDRLRLDLAEAVARSTDEDWARVRTSLGQLSRIHRLELLGAFEAQACTDLDRQLGDLGATPIEGSRLDREELDAVLLKIGDEGLRRLIRADLDSSDPDRRSDALASGLIYPEEISSIADSPDWVVAAVGEDSTLVKRLLAWKEEDLEEDPEEHLKTLRRLRGWKGPMSDADFAPALEALRSTDPKQRVRGLAVFSISGRPDLLSNLGEWLAIENVGQGDLDDLDGWAWYLANYLAERNPDGVRQLAHSLDVSHFPWTAALLLLLDEGASPDLVNRVEAFLLERMQGQNRLRESESELALCLAQIKRLPDPLLQAVWQSGKNSIRMWVNTRFFSVVAQIDSEDVKETIWREAFEGEQTPSRVNAIRALRSMDPDEAVRAARRGLEEPNRANRQDFVSLLLEIGDPDAVPWLFEQAVQERKCAVRWAIARALRQTGSRGEDELRTRLGSMDYREREVAALLAGWQRPGFLEEDLRRLLEEDPDSDVQWECLQALAGQSRERCIRELMESFRHTRGPARWSYLESILKLGDPHLLTTSEDPLWLGHILPPELGSLEVHADHRIQERLEEVRRFAEQRDRSSED